MSAPSTRPRDRSRSFLPCGPTYRLGVRCLREGHRDRPTRELTVAVGVCIVWPALDDEAPVPLVHAEDPVARLRQPAIRNAAERYPVKRLRRGRRKLIDGLRKAPGQIRLSDAAAATVPTLVEAMRGAAAADLRVLENLHRMRITGKRLRYALEIFVSCFDERFREAYANIEALQEHLGAINDSHDLVARIEAFAAIPGAGGGSEAGPGPEVQETIDFYMCRRSARVE